MNEKQLEQWIKGLISNNNVHAFYTSKIWCRVKREVLTEQHNDCQRCKAKGKFTPASTVHHKKYLRRFPLLALTKSNLEAICESCHWEEHHKLNQKTQLNSERW